MKAPHKLMSQLKMQKLSNLFGQEFGSLKYRVRSNILCGNLVLMLCLQKLIYSIEKFKVVQPIIYTLKFQKLFCMLCGVKKKFNLFGKLISAGWTKIKHHRALLQFWWNQFVKTLSPSPIFYHDIGYIESQKQKSFIGKFCASGLNCEHCKGLPSQLQEFRSAATKKEKYNQKEMVSSSGGIHKNKL